MITYDTFFSVIKYEEFNENTSVIVLKLLFTLDFQIDAYVHLILFCMFGFQYEYIMVIIRNFSDIFFNEDLS